MAYTKLDPQPVLRDPDLKWEEIGPGLYEDETALVLEDGIYVAVSVVPKWLENGAGVTFTGTARWIDPDGSTHLCPFGQHVESQFSYGADAGVVQKLGVNVIAKEMILALLGEALTTETIVDDDNVSHEKPLIEWSDELLRNTNIRFAIDLAQSTGPTAIDAGSVLGL